MTVCFHSRANEDMTRLSQRFSLQGSNLPIEDARGIIKDIEKVREDIENGIFRLSEDVDSLMVDRRSSSANSNMTTTSFVDFIEGSDLYQFKSGRGPVEVERPKEVSAADIRQFAMKQDMPRGLRHATIFAQWIFAESNEADDQNILGGTGKLLVRTDETSIDVPVMVATEELLSYYGAHLLQDGDYFHFQTEREYPLFKMNIGENYVNEFIMKKEKGLYLEYHNEPHYHEPLNEQTKGCYCLAREVPSDDPDPADSAIPWKKFHMTCFSIPLGTACYTEPYAIHDDAPTIGEWRVGYVDAEDFSTVTLWNSQSSLLSFEFQAE